MRRYKDLLKNDVDHGQSLDFWDALPVAQEIMRLIDEGDSLNAADLLNWGRAEFPEINDCLVHLLVERLGPKRTGRKVKNTPERLLEIFDFYNLETSGTFEERIYQVASAYEVAFDTASDLYEDGRALGRRLASEHAAEWDCAKALVHEVPEDNEPLVTSRKPNLG